MLVLDGSQAAGKSTVAKAIFFFRTVKDDIVDALVNPYADPVIKSEIQYRLRQKFIQLFGDNISENIFVAFDYDEDYMDDGEYTEPGSNAVRISEPVSFINEDVLVVIIAREYRVKFAEGLNFCSNVKISHDIAPIVNKDWRTDY